MPEIRKIDETERKIKSLVFISYFKKAKIQGETQKETVSENSSIYFPTKLPNFLAIIPSNPSARTAIKRKTNAM